MKCKRNYDSVFAEANHVSDTKSSQLSTTELKRDMDGPNAPVA
jgi:hypothetical protein